MNAHAAARSIARGASRQARPTSASLYLTHVMHFDKRVATRLMKSPRAAGGGLTATKLMLENMGQ